MLTAPARKPDAAPARKQAPRRARGFSALGEFRRLERTITRIARPVPRTSQPSGSISNNANPSGRKRAAPSKACFNVCQSMPSRYAHTAMINIGTLLTDTITCALRASITKGISEMATMPKPKPIALWTNPAKNAMPASNATSPSTTREAPRHAFPSRTRPPRLREEKANSESTLLPEACTPIHLSIQEVSSNR